ncbi:MAG: acetate kinase [Synechococcales cyanobacterium]
MLVLTLNAGSSTQKCCLWRLPDHSLWQAQADWTQQPGHVVVHLSTHDTVQNLVWEETERSQVLRRLLATLTDGERAVLSDLSDIDAVAHRVVHGGCLYTEPTRVTPQVIVQIRALAELAPLHNPVNAAGIEAMEQVLGSGIPQVAVFDTAFHQTLPAAAYTYPIPKSWTARGMRRYGFHGISHRYVAEQTGQVLERDWTSLNLITAHLGNGCSLAAIRGGQSVDTTMGYTPLDGVMMGTRPGALDPGLLLHWWRQGHTLAQVDHLLHHESGLLGVSGVGADLRQVLAGQSAGDPDCDLAIQVYVQRLRAGIGAMLASVGALDALVFTAGVGENSPLIRALVCQDWPCLGMELDQGLNATTFGQDRLISAAGSRVAVVVIHTREDLAMAQACGAVLGFPAVSVTPRSDTD